MNALLIGQIIISILLIGAVALQSSTGGLGGAFGNSGQYHTKRGIEKTLFTFTIVLAVLFSTSSVINLILG